MRIVGGNIPKGGGQLQYVLRVRPAGSASETQLSGNFGEGGGTQAVRIFGSRQVNEARAPQPGLAPAVGEVQPEGAQLVAALLADAKRFEHDVSPFRRDPVGDAPAVCPLLGDQRNDAPRCSGDPAMVRGSLPEPARPTFHPGRAAVEVRKRRTPDERAVPEYPQFLGQADLRARIIPRPAGRRQRGFRG